MLLSILCQGNIKSYSDSDGIARARYRRIIQHAHHPVWSGKKNPIYTFKLHLYTYTYYLYLHLCAHIQTDIWSSFVKTVFCCYFNSGLRLSPCGDMLLLQFATQKNCIRWGIGRRRWNKRAMCLMTPFLMCDSRYKVSMHLTACLILLKPHITYYIGAWSSMAVTSSMWFYDILSQLWLGHPNRGEDEPVVNAWFGCVSVRKGLNSAFSQLT